jgi:hypothetical protein
MKAESLRLLDQQELMELEGRHAEAQLFKKMVAGT